MQEAVFIDHKIRDNGIFLRMLKAICSEDLLKDKLLITISTESQLKVSESGKTQE